MKKLCLTILTGVLFALALVGLHLASADIGLNLPVNTQTGVTATIALGIDEPLGTLSNVSSGNTTTYSDGNYEIQVTEFPSKAHSAIRVIAKKQSGEAFRMNSFSITVRVPRSSIEGIWYPGADPSSTSTMVADSNLPINDVSDANYGIPYIAAASVHSKNVFAMGLGRQDLSVSIQGQPVDQSFYEFRLKVLTPLTSATFDESFYVSGDTSMTWFDTASNYANWSDTINKYVPFPMSTRATEPLYDTWYWSGDQVDDHLYMETAKLASEVGAGLFLADSGWDTAAGEWAKWLGGKTGDYNPPPDKFANVGDTFNNMRSEDNLGIDLWLQPFAVGRESTRYPRTRNMHIQLPTQPLSGVGWGGVTYPPFTLPAANNLEDVNICPRQASTQTYLKNLFTDMATKYNPEGYWLDFIDGMPSYCVAPHTHNYAVFGDGLKHSLETIKSTILSFNPNAVVHFRARYANLNNKSFANVWQSGDSPSDFDRMRLNSIRLHPFSKGVLFSADETYWPDGTSEPQVAKYIMTAVMIGVPAFGPSLIYSPPETLAMLKAWLGFYRSNRAEIATGAFSPFGELNMPNHKIEGQNRTFAYIRNLNFSELVASNRTVFLMNATDLDHLTARVRVPAGHARYSVTVVNRFLAGGTQRLRTVADDNGVMNLDVAVEQGGMVILSPDVETPAGSGAAGAF